MSTLRELVSAINTMPIARELCAKIPRIVSVEIEGMRSRKASSRANTRQLSIMLS